jgi:hypothetical protein
LFCLMAVEKVLEVFYMEIWSIFKNVWSWWRWGIFRKYVRQLLVYNQHRQDTLFQRKISIENL